MKKMFFLALVALLSVACSKSDDNPTTNFPLENLYGTWRITEVEQSDGTMFNVTSDLAEAYFEPTYATFNKDNTFSGRGYFGSGSGTYKAEGSFITCYVEGVEFLKYEIEGFSNTECVLKIHKKGSSKTIKVKCTKQ